jgi:hypothetical protein
MVVVEKLEPLKEALVITIIAIVGIVVFKTAASGLPDGGITGAVKQVMLSV